jgi:RNA polymerase sigma-70 factor (ECF subfamily)
MRRVNSETELILKLSEGDESSFKLLYNLYYQRLYHFAIHYINDDETTKDVLQDVFSDIWVDHKKFKHVHNLSAWLFTLTKNNCLKKIEHMKVEQKHSDTLKYRQLSLIQDSLNELDTSPVIFDEISNIVTKTLEDLSPQCRRVFELSRFENMKNKEIAGELNISLKAVEAHITKSLKIFRKVLKNFLPLIAFLFA